MILTISSKLRAATKHLDWGRFSSLHRRQIVRIVRGAPPQQIEPMKPRKKSSSSAKTIQLPAYAFPCGPYSDGRIIFISYLPLS